MKTGGVTVDEPCSNCPYTGNDLANLPPTAELIDYYRDKVETFEALEEDYIARAAALEQTASERHKTRWQYLRAEAEVVDLQTALSDAKIALFDEREKVVQLCSENDSLKIQEMEDRTRINQLLALSDPQDELTLFQEKPSKRIGGALDTSVRSSTRVLNDVSNQMSTSTIGGAALRTVFAPNKNVEAISLEIESVRLQAEEQRRLWKEKEEVLLEDRRIKEAEFKQFRERHDDQVRELEARIVELEGDVAATTKDYLLVRHQAGKDVHAMQEKLAASQAQYHEVLERLEDLHVKAETDVQTAALAVHERDNCIVQAHKRQAESAEQEVYHLKMQIASENVATTKRIRDLQEGLERSRARHRETATKLHQSVEGLNFDMLSIKRQVRAVVPALHQLLKGGGGGGIGPMPSQSSIGSRVSQRGNSGRERGNVIRTPMHEAKEEEAMPASEILERLTDILKNLDGFALKSDKLMGTPIEAEPPRPIGGEAAASRGRLAQGRAVAGGGVQIKSGVGKGAQV